VVDEERFTVLGGEAEAIAGRMESSWAEGWPMTEALRAAVAALAGPDRTLDADELEVAALARGDGRRAFRRIEDGELTELLGAEPTS
jgi:proteasome alpha subunit